MFAAGTMVSALLYLLPVALVQLVRARRERPLWALALDVPLAVAVDLFAILFLARLFTLEQAAWLSRALWLAAGAAALFLRRGESGPRWPLALGRRELWLSGLAALLATLVSLRLSRSCAIWDRQWHIGLVASIRGQSVPLMNVYEPQGGLYYHYAGDALAAVLQALSFDVLHASLALSLAHDLMFALLGLSLGLLLVQLGMRSVWVVAGVVAATLLVGPATLLGRDGALAEQGYSLVNFLTLSFRPHVSLAGLLMVGLVGAVLVRLEARRRGETLPARGTLPVLFACTGLLALSDESSLGLLGLSLGAVWLFEPDAVHPRRSWGLLALLGLLAVLLGTSLALSGAITLGAPEHSLKWVSWRSPGFYRPPVPFGAPGGIRLAAVDLLPVLSALLASLWAAWHGRGRLPKLLALFYGTLAGLSLLLFTRLEVNGSGLEVHRFASAALFFAPLWGALAVQAVATRGQGRLPLALGGALALGGVGSGVASTVAWVEKVAERQCLENRGFFGTDFFYRTDCREQAGAVLFERPRPTYAEFEAWYLFAGCRPLFSPGPLVSEAGHKVQVGPPRLGPGALRLLHEEWLGPTDPLRVVCLQSTRPTGDPACDFTRSRGSCHSLGPRLLACELGAAERRAMLGGSR